MGFIDSYIDFYCDAYYNISNSSFFRPRLRLVFDEKKEQNAFAPSAPFRNETQRFLRVYVENKGHRSVHNCQAEMTVIIPEGRNMLHPSDERKLLAWGRFPQRMDFITDKRTIRSHGKELLHIVFSDSFFGSVGTANNEEKRYAGISTVENLNCVKSDLISKGSYLKFEDGFATGRFEVEISITSDDGPYTEGKFTIYVEPSFQGLRMKLHSRRLIF
ncbi:MAG: hypothetical protein WCC17_23415 [Candidatus Nitrosopolaris sp.]